MLIGHLDQKRQHFSAAIMWIYPEIKSSSVSMWCFFRSLQYSECSQYSGTDNLIQLNILSFLVVVLYSINVDLNASSIEM